MTSTAVSRVLDVRALKVYYFRSKSAVRSVDDVSFHLNSGEIVGLVGESGCGKSTVALSVTRLVQAPPARIIGGQVFFRGVDLLKLSDKEMEAIRGSGIAMAFQDPATFLNPVVKVGVQISDGIIAHEHVSKREARDRAIKALESVEIPSPENVIEAYPFQLSGGMRQRVFIAIAISLNPSILIADEPTTALDMTVQAQILDLIKQIQRKTNMAVLFITHNFGVVAEICDRVYVMYAGKIVESGNVYDVFKHPKHPYTQALMTLAQSIEDYKHEPTVLKGSVPDLAAPPSGCRFHPRCPYSLPRCIDQEPPRLRPEKTEQEVSCWLYG